MTKLKNITSLGTFKDSYLNKDYSLVKVDAQTLSDYLKGNLEKAGIDYNRFNISHDMVYTGEDQNPPTEIYEYQNFFLMERNNGELILLDGFRRLLYCAPPKHEITVRIYKENDLSKEDIMKLMVYLNHFKFFGISDYYDRGFGLTMYVLFGIDIPAMVKLFDAYLRSTDDTRSYYNSTDEVEDTAAVNAVTNRLIDPLFIDNMIFLSEMKKTNQMVNTFFAIQFREFIDKYQKSFTANEFLGKVKGDKVLDELLVKFKKYGTTNNVDSTKVIRQIKEIYETVFNSFLGIETKKPYAVQLEECKQLSLVLKKDKKWVKLTRKRDISNETEKIINLIKSGKPPKIKAVAFPFKRELGKNDRPVVTPGVYEVKFMRVKKMNNWPHHDELHISLDENGSKYINAEPGYSRSYLSTSSYFNEIRSNCTFLQKNGREYSVDADIFVCYE